MENQESSDNFDVPVIDYPRPRRSYSGMFAGWFVTIGSVNLVLGALIVAYAVLAVVGSIIALRRNLQLPLADLAMAPFTLLAGGLLLVGSIGSFWRAHWSRKMVRAGLAGLLAVSAVNLLLGFAHHEELETVWILWLMVAYTAYLAFALSMYSGLRADFYFHPAHPSQPTATSPILASGVALRMPVATFKVSGIDTATGQQVSMTSRAKTEALARKSAIMMGMIEETIQVQAIAAVEGPADQG